VLDWFILCTKWSSPTRLVLRGFWCFLCAWCCSYPRTVLSLEQWLTILLLFRFDLLLLFLSLSVPVKVIVCECLGMSHRAGLCKTILMHSLTQSVESACCSRLTDRLARTFSEWRLCQTADEHFFPRSVRRAWQAVEWTVSRRHPRGSAPLSRQRLNTFLSPPLPSPDPVVWYRADASCFPLVCHVPLRNTRPLISVTLKLPLITIVSVISCLHSTSRV